MKKIKIKYQPPICFTDHTLLQRIARTWELNERTTFYFCPKCFQSYISKKGNKIEVII